MPALQGRVAVKNYPHKIMQSFIQLLSEELIPDERKSRLLPFIQYLQEKRAHKADINLNFICTHNSRRSQFAQVWCAALAQHFDLKLNCFSGGTERTAVYPEVLNSLESFGFKVKRNVGENPHHLVQVSTSTSLILFSKRFNDDVNPKKDFAALMTCSDADENCPFIPGCELRLALNYSDPKRFDGSPIEASMYNARSWQIASEFFYVFQTLKHSEND